MNQKQSFATRAVHAGERSNLAQIHPVVTPIYASVGYTFANSHHLDEVIGGEQEGFVYSPRYGNPTIQAFETAVANLEGAEAAFAFASGMSAIHMALLAAGVRAGMTVVAAADIYGATYTLLQEIFSELGVTCCFVDVLNLAEIETAVAEQKPRVLLVETISNPLMKVADLPRIANIAQQNQARLLVDNTFCSPYLANPLRFGADLVIHSATKYISGHGDVMGGIVATNRQYRAELLRLNKLIGSSMGPFEAWLAMRGLKTLGLRMKQQCDNALLMASWLQTHPNINHVNYPFLPDHDQYELMQHLSGGLGAGAVLSFEIHEAGRKEIFAFMDALQLVQPATSLGDIYSLLLYPAISSHRSLSVEERLRLGIGDGMVRLSCGIEAFEDIQADVAQALEVF